jgi:type III secretion protein N (ATPase)
VLTEGDGSLDPVAEEVTSILDGHIVLSASLAQKNHFPAIDVLRSRSRLMDSVVRPLQRQSAAQIRQSMALYADVQLLLQVGEYSAGSDPQTDDAIARQAAIEQFLRQDAGTQSDYGHTVRALIELMQ